MVAKFATSNKQVHGRICQKKQADRKKNHDSNHPLVIVCPNVSSHIFLCLQFWRSHRQRRLT